MLGQIRFAKYEKLNVESQKLSEVVSLAIQPVRSLRSKSSSVPFSGLMLLLDRKYLLLWMILSMGY